MSVSPDSQAWPKRLSQDHESGALALHLSSLAAVVAFPIGVDLPLAHEHELKVGEVSARTTTIAGLYLSASSVAASLTFSHFDSF